MSYMFCFCIGLKELNVSTFKTGKVTDLTSMFNSCSELIELNLSSFKADPLTKMGNMLLSCDKLKKINLSSFMIDQVKVNHKIDIPKSCEIICNDESLNN